MITKSHWYKNRDQVYIITYNEITVEGLIGKRNIKFIAGKKIWT